jgi:hypothetical protein
VGAEMNVPFLGAEVNLCHFFVGAEVNAVLRAIPFMICSADQGSLTNALNDCFTNLYYYIKHLRIRRSIFCHGKFFNNTHFIP